MVAESQHTNSQTAQSILQVKQVLVCDTFANFSTCATLHVAGQLGSYHVVVLPFTRQMHLSLERLSG